MSSLMGAMTPLLITLCSFAAADSPDPSLEPAGLAPMPATVPAPADNPAAVEKIELGKLLFFDPRLSGGDRTSCASCHIPEKAWADGRERGEGVGGKRLDRNTPSVLNAGLLHRFHWDGRAGSLEEQALLPIESAAEMKQDLGELERELQAIPEYADRFQSVFGTPVTRQAIGQALAAFERTLVSRDSPYDRYLAGDAEALSESAKRGLRIFRDEADCIRCHQGPLLTDERFHRIGVSFRDRGRAELTGRRDDLHKFRTPPLRDVARTAPYMHDGSMESLTDVVEFYFRFVPRQGPDGLEIDVKPLDAQSYMQIDDVVSFLESLTGRPPALTPPKLPGPPTE